MARESQEHLCRSFDSIANRDQQGNALAGVRTWQSLQIRGTRPNRRTPLQAVSVSEVDRGTIGRKRDVAIHLSFAPRKELGLLVRKLGRTQATDSDVSCGLAGECREPFGGCSRCQCLGIRKRMLRRESSGRSSRIASSSQLRVGDIRTEVSHLKGNRFDCIKRRTREKRCIHLSARCAD